MTFRALFIVLVLVVFAIWLARKDPRLSLFTVVFLSPWQGLDLDVGLRITAYQIFLAPLLMVTLHRNEVREHFQSMIPLLAFVLYASLWTLMQMPFLPEWQVAGGAFRAPAVRSFLQIPVMVLALSPVLVVRVVARSREDLIMLGKVYIFSVVCLALLGWLQLITWYSTGTNPLPIGFIDSLLGGMAEAREGLHETLGLLIYRMNSLGGEPKNLGQAFVIAMLLIQVIAPLSSSAGKLALLWLFLAISTVATLSTTAFFLLAVGSVVIVVLGVVFREGETSVLHSVGRLGSYLLITAMLTAISISIAETNNIPVTDLLLERTVERVETSELGAFEDFDAAIRDYLLDHPTQAITGVGLGNIHLYAEPYLNLVTAAFVGDGVFVAKAQYLRFISEVGFIGFGLFLYWYGMLVVSANRCLIAAGGLVNSAVLIPFGIVNVLVYLAAGAGAPQFFLIAGALVASCDCSRDTIP